MDILPRHLIVSPEYAVSLALLVELSMRDGSMSPYICRNVLIGKALALVPVSNFTFSLCVSGSLGILTLMLADALPVEMASRHFAPPSDFVMA